LPQGRQQSRRQHSRCVPSLPCKQHELLLGPDDTFTEKSAPTPSKPDIAFAVSLEAANHNADLLRECDYAVAKFLESQRGTTAGFGSEFRPTSQLKPLLGHHPGYAELETIIDHGMDYQFLVELSETERSNEMLANLQRGNHKSAETNSLQVAKLLLKDVTHGFAWVVPKYIVPLIPEAMVEPLGLAEQWTLDEQGNRVPKYRLTQDLSFTFEKAGPPKSINSRIDMQAYPEMIYGWCIQRIIHFIVLR
jgi:hypothetical protein